MKYRDLMGFSKPKKKITKKQSTPKTNKVVGKNTISAINSGFFFGYTCLIDNIIHSIIKQTKKKYKIIFTGGLAKMFKNSLKLRVKIKSNLTTDGVLKAAMNLNKWQKN